MKDQIHKILSKALILVLEDKFHERPFFRQNIYWKTSNPSNPHVDATTLQIGIVFRQYSW